MKRRGSPRVQGYALVGAVGLVAALALRRPELAIAVVPFALVLGLGTRFGPDPRIGVDFALGAERTVEGAPVDCELALRGAGGVDRLEIALELPRDVVADEGNAVAVRLRADEERVLPFRLHCSRWGVYDIGAIEVRARDPFRLVVWERRFRRIHRLRAYPRSETVGRIVSPLETQAFTGSEVARIPDEGIEYADLRDYVPGDRLRSINWRASARKAELVVNQRHPERNTDVVLFLDSFADVRGTNRSTLDDAVRAAATLAMRYLERRDRVGLVTFGGILRWLQPGLGVAQRYRLVETLLETGIEPTYTWRDVERIPPRILPPKSLVIALSPLVDPRFVAALENLRVRGFDVVAVEVDPAELVSEARDDVERLARRLWLLEREVLRSRLQRLGIGVARWGDGVSLDAALEEVRTYRRYARLAHA